jgi:ABC-type sugar transport system substrate-binding protein
VKKGQNILYISIKYPPSYQIKEVLYHFLMKGEYVKKTRLITGIVAVISLLSMLVFAGCQAKPEVVQETQATESATESVAETEETAAETEAQEEFNAVQEAINNFKTGGAKFETGEGKYTIGISMCLFDQPYWIGMYAGFLQGGREFNAKIIMQNANLDIPKQMAHFEDYITAGVDGLVIVPTDTEATSAVIEVANKAGVPVVEANRITTGGDYAAVMYDNIKTAELAAEAMKKAADELGFTEVKVVELVGDLKIAIGAERHEGFINKAKEFDNFEVVAQVPTEWLHENVYPACIDGFTAHPDGNAVYLSSDLMTQPTLSALDSLGKMKPAGDPGHVILITVDGQPIACENIRTGFVDASINHECFEIGYKSVETVVKMIEGGTIDPKIQLLPLVTIDKSNVDDPKLWGNALAGVVE